MLLRNRFVLTTLIISLVMVLTTGFAHAVDKKDLKAPAAGHRQILKLQDGSTMIGRITEVGDTDIRFATDMGEMVVQIGKIKDIQEVSESSFKGGAYWFPNPNATRLYIAPTARTLKAGKGYFYDSYIFFPGIAFGITDNIQLGGGVSLFPGVDFKYQLFYLQPKIGVSPSENVHLAASATIIRLPEFDSDDDAPETFGMFYGMTTLGTDDRSFTGGLGFGYIGEDIADKPVVLLGGEYRLGRRISFVTENWIIPDVDEPLISYGLRFFGEGLAIDLAFFNILDDDAIFPGIPYIDFVWNF